MTIDRFVRILILAAAFAVGFMAVARAMSLRAGGVRAVVADHQRSAAETAVDAFAVLVVLLWWFEIIAYALPLPFHLAPPPVDIVLLNAVPTKTLGAGLGMLAAAGYGITLSTMAKSWRVGIDRADPGPLVTNGVFQWSRNPIYVSLETLSLGAFLVFGNIDLLLFTLLLIGIMHRQIRREEDFLTSIYGAAYTDYCSHVGRYSKWW
jgi:protein-S-isoprenylcysteine O-methyltransferase Ste14